MDQELHEWQIITENEEGKLNYMNIESEDYELTEDLFHTVQKWTSFNTKILSIARIN